MSTSDPDQSPGDEQLVDDLAHALGTGSPPADVIAAAKGLAEKLPESTDPIVLPGHTIITEPDGTGDWSCSCGAAGSGAGSRDDHEQENRPVIPDLYDVEAALLEVARARRRRDEPTIAIAQLAERLSANLARHFGPEATETAGLALVIAAASIGALVREGIPAEAVTNLLAFAGQRVVVDARAADGNDAAPFTRPAQEETARQ